MTTTTVFLAADATRTVISARKLDVPGGTLNLRGPVADRRARGADRLGRHGSALFSHLAVAAADGIACGLAIVLHLELVARLLALALVLVLWHTAVVYRRTERTSEWLRRGHEQARIIVTADERGDLEVVLRLVDRIWASHPHDHAGDPAAGVLSRAVLAVSETLDKRQQLGLLRDEASGGERGGPSGLLADRHQRTRLDTLWATVDAEVAGHIAALRVTAEAGESRQRESELGAAARRSGADGLAQARLEHETAAYRAAYGALSARFTAEPGPLVERAAA